MNETPKNATDRNVEHSYGMWRGHITLPSSFLTGLILVICASFLLVIYWQNDQQTQIRERLRQQEVLVATLLGEKIREDLKHAASSGPVAAPGSAPAPLATPKPEILFRRE